MKGIILHKGKKKYTYLKELFDYMDGEQKKYNWLITDYECYPTNETINEILSDDLCWISGEKLTEMVQEENFQWIWGYFLAFPKDILLEDVLKSKLPIANGNRSIWKNPITMSHSHAIIEMIAWDSCMTLIISRIDSLINTLAERIPFSEDLEKYNE